MSKKQSQDQAVRRDIGQLADRLSLDRDEQKHEHAEIMAKIETLIAAQRSSTPSSSTPPVPTSTAQSPQRLMPPPKAVLDPAQLLLQHEFIIACEQGDIKEVKKAIKEGANPSVANATGKCPLGAAIWGMNPEVVNILQIAGVSPMSWAECEKHNMKHYNEVFMISKFDPQTFEEWHTLLQKMDPSPFVRALHLEAVKAVGVDDDDDDDDVRHDDDSSSWEEFKKGVMNAKFWQNNDMPFDRITARLSTEQKFASLRSQIKQGIETASRSQCVIS